MKLHRLLNRDVLGIISEMSGLNIRVRKDGHLYKRILTHKRYMLDRWVCEYSPHTMVTQARLMASIRWYERMRHILLQANCWHNAEFVFSWIAELRERWCIAKVILNDVWDNEFTDKIAVGTQHHNTHKYRFDRKHNPYLDSERFTV